jgi:hypothetical protein
MLNGRGKQENTPVVLMGHSRGGAVTALAAASILERETATKRQSHTSKHTKGKPTINWHLVIGTTTHPLLSIPHQSLR